MNVLRLAGQIILIVLLYRLIVYVILPAYRSTRQIHRQFGQMRDKMQEMQEQQNRAQNHNMHTSTSSNDTTDKKVGDYIDFEEIK